MSKRAINWVEIKARFLAGERPADIAKDYRSCTAAKVSQKANRGKWVQEREEIKESVASAVEAELIEVARGEAGRVSEKLRQNAETAATVEAELLEAQLAVIRNGRKFFDLLESVIKAHADEEAVDPKERKAIIQELRNTSMAVFEKVLPAKLVVAAFTTARAESDLVADEEYEQKRQKAGGNKKETTKFVLNVRRQEDALKEMTVEDTD